MTVNIVTDIFDLDSDRMIVNVDKCVTKEGVFHNWTRERIENILSKCYCGQTIIMKSHDGANLLRTGFYPWVESLQHCFNIANHKIVFNTIIPPENSSITDGVMQARYPWQQVGLKAFLDADQNINKNLIDQNLSQAKFVGALAMGRWSLWRLKLIYELDQAFPDDTFITHNKNNSLFFLKNANEFDKELQWLETKTFDVDPNIDPENVYPVDYKKAYGYYHSIWNRYKIEVVLETDEYQNQWFTDKIGKCLATGKPFVLVAGTGSLHNLKNLGFKTFDNWIDESYDQCRSPSQRIQHIVASLQALYNHTNQTFIIDEMNNRAKENVEIFKHYVQSKI